MPVRRLAGPFPITNGEPVVGGQQCTAIDGLFYHPYIGLMGQLGFPGIASSRHYVLAHDGVAFQCGGRVGFPGRGWWVTASRMVEQVNLGEGAMERVFDNRGLTSQLTTNGIQFSVGNSNYLRLKDSWVIFANRVLEVTATNEVIHASPHLMFGIVSASLTRGRKPDEVFAAENFTIFHTVSHAFFWDLTKQELSSPRLTFPHSYLYLYYAYDLGVVLACRSISGVFNIEIFSIETEPTTVSTPIHIGGFLTEGRKATFQVQVLGGESEPVQGQKVDWTTDVGTVLIPQSVTDIEGYATTDIRFGIGDTGSVTVRGSVTC